MRHSIRFDDPVEDLLERVERLVLHSNKICNLTTEPTYHPKSHSETTIANQGNKYTITIIINNPSFPPVR